MRGFTFLYQKIGLTVSEVAWQSTAPLKVEYLEQLTTINELHGNAFQQVPSRLFGEVVLLCPSYALRFLGGV
jgi:hypothetical protein